MNCHRGFFWKRRIKLARAARGAMAIWFAVLSLGVSLPVPAVNSTPDAGDALAASGPGQQAFPCQDHRCGCRDAQHCWRSCCCMSREQKFAWAVEHGVKPPSSFFAEQAPASHAGIAKKAVSAEPRSCCAKHQPMCAVAGEPKSSTCASSGKSAGGAPGRQVSLISALGCQGTTMSWMFTISPSVRPEAALGDLAAECTGAPLIGEPSLKVCSPSFAPPVPPPRHG